MVFWVSNHSSFLEGRFKNQASSFRSNFEIYEISFGYRPPNLHEI